MSICTVILIIDSVDIHSEWSVPFRADSSLVNLDHTNSLSFDLMALSENLESLLFVFW